MGTYRHIGLDQPLKPRTANSRLKEFRGLPFGNIDEVKPGFRRQGSMQAGGNETWLLFQIGGSFFPECQTLIFLAFWHFEGIDQDHRRNGFLPVNCRPDIWSTRT